MKPVTITFDVNSMLAGAIIAGVFSGLSGWWLAIAIVGLLNCGAAGIPAAEITYRTGHGWRLRWRRP